MVSSPLHGVLWRRLVVDEGRSLGSLTLTNAGEALLGGPWGGVT